MICRDSLLWRNVAEHSFLLVVVAAHSLFSLAFLTSDEFFELKLQRKWVFQQTARRSCSFVSAGPVMSGNPTRAMVASMDSAFLMPFLQPHNRCAHRRAQP